MINRSNPQQILLFDRVEEILHPKAKARLDENWPGVFRQAILQLMPVKELGEGFSPNFGRPSKEHYSICGLLLLKEYFGWTDEETIDQYLYSFKIQYALKIQPDNLKLSVRTLARYQKIFREKELAQKLMQDVTSMIIRELNIQYQVDQRDSNERLRQQTFLVQVFRPARFPVRITGARKARNFSLVKRAPSASAAGARPAERLDITVCFRKP
jgi:hypothetical protein